jgi:hypothetical protein
LLFAPAEKGKKPRRRRGYTALVSALAKFLLPDFTP